MYKNRSRKNNYVLTYDLWVLSWIGLRITSEQILGNSYGPVYQSIINDIQQNNIGQLFDIDYLVSLTMQMRALLYNYSSKQLPFTIEQTTTQFNPVSMVTSDWQEIIRLLWQTFKSFLTFN